MADANEICISVGDQWWCPHVISELDGHYRITLAAGLAWRRRRASRSGRRVASNERKHATSTFNFTPPRHVLSETALIALPHRL